MKHDTPIPLIATREAGLARLQEFLPRAGEAYAAGRNFDDGPGRSTAVSALSPYVRHRLIAEQEIVAATLRLHSVAASEKFVQEVCWRSYWKGWLQQRPAVWQRYCEQRDAQFERLRASAGLRLAWTQATGGHTGIECFDAWSTELRETATLHNHARMWFASIWIFTLRLPWELGADFFLQHLADADAASNTLSWRWVAGLHTAGKHYLARADNIARYTRGRFDPRGQLAEDASPLPADAPVAAGALSAAAPLQPGLPTALLMTDEHCSVERLWPAGAAAPVAIGVWRGGIDARSPQPLGAPARAFALGALDDAAQRAARHWAGVPIAQEVQDLAAWQQASGATQLALAEPCTGPTADSLAGRLDAMAKAGIVVTRLRSDWDAAFWPHATKGYFQLRQRIPEITARLI